MLLVYWLWGARIFIFITQLHKLDLLSFDYPHFVDEEIKVQLRLKPLTIICITL